MSLTSGYPILRCFDVGSTCMADAGKSRGTIPSFRRAFSVIHFELCKAPRTGSEGGCSHNGIGSQPLKAYGSLSSFFFIFAHGLLEYDSSIPAILSARPHCAKELSRTPETGSGAVLHVASHAYLTIFAVPNHHHTRTLI